ncbi:hypothetical protein IQ07DRAFT_604812 [Pyrenochaeta sp. DS3sAY3a]|nr:hypothetical protein IQ07DRAFT_604812 [Pyrenochaeta sp. DS3sAY3a]
MTRLGRTVSSVLLWSSGSGEVKFRLDISRKYSLELLCYDSVVGRPGELHMALQEDIYAHCNNSKTGHIMHPPPGSRPKAVVCQLNASPSSLGRSDKSIRAASAPAKHRSAGPHGPPGTVLVYKCFSTEFAWGPARRATPLGAWSLGWRRVRRDNNRMTIVGLRMLEQCEEPGWRLRKRLCWFEVPWNLGVKASKRASVPNTE